MLNKLILMVLIGMLLSLSLNAQSSRYGRRRSRQTTQQSLFDKEQKNDASAKNQIDSTKKKQSSKKNSSQSELSKFKKPTLSKNTVSYILDTEIKKQLLERKIPAKIPGFKSTDEDSQDDDNQNENDKPTDSGNTEKNKFLSQMGLAILISRYSSLIANFELSEVTGVRQEWYQQLLGELQKFGLIINEMETAIRIQSNSRYAAAVQKFKDHQKACLNFLKEKPPKLSKEEYTALVLKNTKIRQQNYLKRLREEREAAMKQRQEQLKQLQQKNQSKNQGTTQSGVK